MAATHSKPLLQGEFPQYAYALAILTGGIVFMVAQMGAPRVAWASYALLGTLLGAAWPRGGLQWGFWLCLPIILMIFFEVVLTWRLGGLWGYGIILMQSLGCACVGAYLGSIISRRRVINRSANKRVKRKRASVAAKVAQPLPASRKLAAPLHGSVTTNSSSQSEGSVAAAIEPAARIHALNAALIEAVKAGDLNRIERLVADGADVNAKSRERWSPLTTASPGGDVDMVETLFGEGAIKANSLDGQGWTPLMIATIEGHREVVRALLEYGVEVNAWNNQGWTALRFAVSMDETEILRLLLAAGADANLVDDEGTTALMQAAVENSVDSLKALLDAGADPLFKDRNRQTALTLAQKQGHTNVIKLLKGAEAGAANKPLAPAAIPCEASRAGDKTHRVIKVLRDHAYGSMARYNAIPLGAALPFGCEETGREGNEEECLDYAWRSSIDVQPKLAGLLGFREKLPSP
jgi:ankyrin repeat protein